MEPMNQVSVQDSKRYEPPAVVYEAALEVRAGTPLGIPANPLDSLGAEQGE